MARKALIYDDSSGQFITVPAPIVAYPGNGTTGPFTITHNWGTLGVNVIVILNSTGEEVEVHKTRTQNTVVLSPDVVWNVNERTATLNWICQTDNTPPSTASLAFVSKTNTSITVTPSGATDADSGVRGYLIYKDGIAVNGLSTLVASGANYAVTGLSSNTQYSITAKAVDNAGNVSAAFSTAVVQTTDASSPVAFSAAGAYVQSTANQMNSSTATTCVVPAGLNNILVAACVTSHVGNVAYPGGYTSISCTSSIDGALTALAGSSVGNAGGGNVILYYKLNATPGTHTVTFAANTGATWHDFGRIACACYTGVGSIVLRNTRTGNNTSAALSAAITSATDNMAIMVVASDASAITVTAGTSRANGGSSANGTADFLRIIDIAGAATATITGSTSTIHGYVCADLVKV